MVRQIYHQANKTKANMQININKVVANYNIKLSSAS